jgi:hypothetical protein
MSFNITNIRSPGQFIGSKARFLQKKKATQCCVIGNSDKPIYDGILS